MTAAQERLAKMNAERKELISKIDEGRAEGLRVADSLEAIQLEIAALVERADAEKQRLVRAIAEGRAEEEIASSRAALSELESKGAAVFARTSEVEALLRESEEIQKRMIPLGVRISEIDASAKDVVRHRMNEIGHEIAAKFKAATDTVADLSAEAHALNRLADAVDLPAAYAPQVAYPAISLDAVGYRSGENLNMVTIHLDALIAGHQKRIVERLRAEGFPDLY